MDRNDIISDIHEHCINIPKRELYLHGYFGNTDEDPGIEYRQAVQFTKNLHILDNLSNEPIWVHMHSTGGELNSGMVMFDAIITCSSPVYIVVYGQAESMSGILLQAASKRIMMPHSYFMAHYFVSGVDGRYIDVQVSAKFDKYLHKIIVNIYAEKMVKSKFFKEKHGGGSLEKAANFLNRKFKEGDWYLSPEDTVYYGFADCLWGDRKYKAIIA